jgi:hydrogenase nickel incorporation protein HypB
MNPLTSKYRSELNERAARANRENFDAAGVTSFTVVGPAGSGKTSIIEGLLLRLAPPLRSAVIMANLAADRQISRIMRHGYQTVPIKADTLAASHIRDVLPQLNLPDLDMLFIEVDGNSVSPVEFDLGHHYRIGVFSAAGGDDKANEFPQLVAKSDLVLLTKIDLLPFVHFDSRVFAEDIARIKPDLPVLQLSVQSGEGFSQLREWIRARIAASAATRAGEYRPAGELVTEIKHFR